MHERLKKIREHFNLSQKDFAKKINLSQNAISTFESGNRNLSDRTIHDICNVYGVSETWLRTGDGKMFADLTRDEKLVMEFGRILTDDDCGIKKRIIETLVKFSDAELEVALKLINQFMRDLYEQQLEEEKEEDSNNE